MGKLAVVTKGVNTMIEQSQTAGGVMTVVRKVLPGGVEMMMAVKVPNKPKKALLKPAMKAMSEMGISQKAIATFTNVSQSYVSKLVNS